MFKFFKIHKYFTISKGKRSGFISPALLNNISWMNTKRNFSPKIVNFHLTFYLQQQKQTNGIGGSGPDVASNFSCLAQASRY
jgi:hypothetical protein